MIMSRILAAALGLAIPLAMAGAADAATTHRRVSHPARVSTATYKVAPHKARAHHYRASSRSHRAVAQAARHSTSRGS